MQLSALSISGLVAVEKGFSLLELIVVMALLSIMSGYALMQYSDVVASFNRQNGVNQIEFDLRRARAEAVAQGARGVFHIPSSAVSYTFGLDLLPFSDPPEADSQSFSRTLPNNVTFESATLVFDSRGYLIDESTGSPTTAALSVFHRGTEFCVVSVTAIGTVSLSCP